MSTNYQLKISQLNAILLKNIKEIGSPEINPNENEILKYCELIGEKNSIFFNDESAITKGLEGKIMHPGYIMSLTNPYVQQILTKNGPEIFSKLIKAFIHVGSNVEFIKPMIINKKYKIGINLSEPIEKKAKSGNYCSMIMKFSIYDKNREIFAKDDHICFFKL